MDLSEQILVFLRTNIGATAKQIIKETGQPRSSVFKVLNQMVQSGQLKKEGKPPHVSYRIQILHHQPASPAPSVPIPTPSHIPDNFSPEPPRPAPSLPPKQDNPLPQRMDMYSLRQWLLRKLALDADKLIQGVANPKRLILLVSLLLGGFVLYQIYHYYSPQSQAGRLRQELAQVKEELHQSRVDFYKSRDELNRKELEIKSQTAHSNYDGKRFDQFKEQLSASHEESMKLRGQIEKLQETIRELQRERVGFKNENQKLTRNLEYLERDKKRLQERQDEKDGSRAKLESQIKELRQTIVEKDKQLDNRQVELTLKDRQIKELQAKSSSIEPKSALEPVVIPTRMTHVPIDQIVTWTKEGVPTQEIIRRIKDSRSSYALTNEDLGYLKRFNVSPQVIEVMQEK